jgi:DNA-binding SARP family transcriptional activator
LGPISEESAGANVLRLRTFGGLWVESADGRRVGNPRPRRLALLAILAAAGRRGVSRSRLRAIFWPDADDERARHALSQTLYALRQDLGRPVIKTETDVRLDPEQLRSDTESFREAVARADWPAAAALYQGAFAAGFSLDDSPEFNRWLDEERAALAREAESALEALAREAAAAGDSDRAAEAWHRLTQMDPASARFATAYMAALAEQGDRAAAIAHAREHADHLRRELDLEPEPGVTALVERLRLETKAAPAPPLRPSMPSPPGEAGGSASAATVSARAEPVGAPAVGRKRLWPWVGIAAGSLAALTIAVIALRPGGSEGGAPVLAVGQIRDLTAPDSVQLGGVLSEVFATSLARLSGVELIANSRVLELLDPGSDTLRAARTDAARRAGATEIVEGELVPTPGGQLRLDMRRVEIRRGTLRGGYSVTGGDRLALIDSATSLIAADLRVGVPVRPLSEFTPRSPIALRLYEEGLRAYYLSDPQSAQRLFREALVEDSTFALAAYYSYRVSQLVGPPNRGLEALALRLADRAPDRDRLLILTSVRMAQHDPAAAAYADTLATRFPRDPEALVRAAEAMTQPRLIGPRARDLFERAIAMDSAARLSPNAPCRLCSSLASLNDALLWADSVAAADQVLERYARLKPEAPGPIQLLAMNRFIQGRYEAGAEILARLAAFPSEGRTYDAIPLFLGRLLTGHLDEADAECTVQLRQTDPRAVDRYAWLCPIVWRNQGRYHAASGFIFSRRRPDGGRMGPELPADRVNEFILDLEMGRPLLALRTLERVVPTEKEASTPGLLARELTWNLVRRGTAAAAARELALTVRLADSAEQIGPRSLFGRDPLLHFFLRGLVARSAGDHQTAADFFRRSVHSWTFGYTRANWELARSLVALGRAAEAIRPLQAALRGGWDGSNLYVTRTELHELLAEAFAAGGLRDSAAAHYVIVERSWRRADPAFAARYQTARDWLARHGRLVD